MWVIILNALLMGIAAVSVGAALVATTGAGILMALILVLGIAAFTSGQVRNGYLPAQ